MISYVLALLAAIVNAACNVLNRKAALGQPAQERFRLGLILGLLHRPVWLTAVGLMTLSFVFSSAALGTGQLASVQLIIVLALPLTLIGGSWALRRRLGVREWLATAGMTAGAIGLLAILDPRPGVTGPVPPLLWNPAVSTCWGVLVLGERVSQGPILWLTILPLLALAAGVVALSRSAVLRAAQAAQDQPGLARAGHGGQLATAGYCDRDCVPPTEQYR